MTFLPLLVFQSEQILIETRRASVFSWDNCKVCSIHKSSFSVMLQLLCFCIFRTSQGLLNVVGFFSFHCVSVLIERIALCFMCPTWKCRGQRTGINFIFQHHRNGSHSSSHYCCLPTLMLQALFFPQIWTRTDSILMLLSWKINMKPRTTWIAFICIFHLLEICLSCIIKILCWLNKLYIKDWQIAHFWVHWQVTTIGFRQSEVLLFFCIREIVKVSNQSET